MKTTALTLILSLATPYMAQLDPSSYAGSPNIECPDSSALLRTFPPSNQTLGAGETSYISGRAQKLPQAWTQWLGDGSQLGYDLGKFAAAFPKVGIAVSGGGFRASLFGAGVVAALDGRNDTARNKGTGGLLQVAQYMSGLSGGSWLAASMAYNNFPQIRDLVLGNSGSGGDLAGWLLDLDIAIPNGINIFNDKNQEYYGSVLWSVYSKADKGFDTSLSDPWSRVISYHFLPGTTRDNFFTNDSSHGAGLLWSDLQTAPALRDFSLPFPILVANSRASGSNSTERPPLDSTVYEITPYEMGSFDPSLSAMTNVQFLGTHLVNGKPANSTACVKGFDQAGFMIGTVSSLFNIGLNRAEGIIDGFDIGPTKALIHLLDRQLAKVTTRKDDVANWPNPFQSVSPSTYQDSNATWLSLVDGGQNVANVPLEPLFLKARGLDVVLAVDTTAETTNGTKFNFPNGTAIRAARERITTILSSTHQSFPPIPDDFFLTGVSLRPTFFGCDPIQTLPEWPMLIYIPNAPPVDGTDPVTNPGAFKSSYTVKHQNLFLDQSFSIATSGFVPGSTGSDENFPKCFQCAVIDRARLKTSPVTPRSDFCSQCFQRYCFDPANPPSAADVPGRKMTFVDPDPQTLSKVGSFLNKNKIALGVGIGVGILLSIGLCIFFSIRVRRNRVKRGNLGVYKPVQADDEPWKARRLSAAEDTQIPLNRLQYHDPWETGNASGLPPNYGTTAQR